ncbi:phage tail protein [Burkholderia multivorans]|nr:phage tail protein [Burkholderia multivorans]
MPDLYHYWGGDLVVSPSGDLAVANDSDTTTQQILRALMTNPALSDAAGNAIASADYSDHPTFGAGLPRKIGSTISIPAVRAIVRSVVYSFHSVCRSPAPTIDVQPFNDGATINIQYVNAVTGETDTLYFDINK